nr:putative phage tail protein [uncultured Mediterranean phage uvMED]
MEERGSAHLTLAKAGELVPAEVFRAPLLPYEWQLVSTLGVSEEEYRQLKSELAAKVRERRPEYAHVPDVQMGPMLVPILINLAIGAVLTGIGMLLAPKPQQQEEDDRKSIELANNNGRSRFNNNVGFDSSPQLATLGARVPIVFGKFVAGVDDPDDTDATEFQQTTGGIVAEPLLVWSRMQSNGSFQSLKLKMVVGQATMGTTPKIAGVMIGGQPLTTFAESNYALYYSSVGGGNNRLNQEDWVSGEASPGEEPFLVPTLWDEQTEAFSMAHSPSNNASFGLYHTIPNGGYWKVNWRVIGYAKDQSSDADKRSSNERRKIAGGASEDRDQGMNGTGRCYNNLCGMWQVERNGKVIYSGGLPQEVDVKRGDIVIYRIADGDVMPDEGNTGIEEVTTEDLENRSASIRERADDMLQVGEMFLSNRTIMRVMERPAKVWHRRSEGDRLYRLEVTGFIGGDKTIGLVGDEHFDGGKLVSFEGGDNSEYRDSFTGLAFYPLHKIDMAQVRNTRKTEVTELGIKSQVYNRASGLCNFAEVPDPDDLEDWDNDNVQISTGTMSKYMARTSYFYLGVKDVDNPFGLNEDGQDVNDDDNLFDGFFIDRQVVFGVRGSAPVDVFNYIRIKHPQRAQYEFKLIPIASANFIRSKIWQQPGLWILSHGDRLRAQDYQSPYGTFHLKFHASEWDADEITAVPEMRQSGKFKSSGGSQKVTGVQWMGPDRSGKSYEACYEEQILGQVKPTPYSSEKYPWPYSKSETITFTDQGVTLTLKINATMARAQDNSGYWEKHKTMKFWVIQSVEVLAVSGAPFNGMIVKHTVQLTKGWYTYHHGARNEWIAMQYQISTGGVVGTPQRGDREFETYAQVKEISAYEELAKSCDDSPEHQISYMNESQECEITPQYGDLTMVGLKLRSLNSVAQLQQIQVYFKDGITVEKLLSPGQRGPSNNFADLAYYLLTEVGRGVGSEISKRLIDKDSFIHAAKFTAHYKLFFNGAISEAVNVRSFLSQVAPLFLCNLVIKNGRFALVPGVPTDNEGWMRSDALEIGAYFNDGNILDGSFKLTYTEQADRQDFRAVCKYRNTPVNGLTDVESIMVKWKYGQTVNVPTQEDFDMTQFCTSRHHAFYAARYLLSLRKRVDHIIEFQTTTADLSIAPGDYIRVDTAVSPYEASRNVVVRQDLTLLTASQLDDGIHCAVVYRQGSEQVVDEEIKIVNGRVTDETLAGAMFNVTPIGRRFGTYLVESVGLTEEGLVDVRASHFPVFKTMEPKIVDDILWSNRMDKFEVVE